MTEKDELLCKVEERQIEIECLIQKALQNSIKMEKDFQSLSNELSYFIKNIEEPFDTKVIPTKEKEKEEEIQRLRLRVNMLEYQKNKLEEDRERMKAETMQLFDKVQIEMLTTQNENIVLKKELATLKRKSPEEEIEEVEEEEMGEITEEEIESKACIVCTLIKPLASFPIIGKRKNEGPNKTSALCYSCKAKKKRANKKARYGK